MHSIDFLLNFSPTMDWLRLKENTEGKYGVFLALKALCPTSKFGNFFKI